jgi:YfiH family protein
MSLSYGDTDNSLKNRESYLNSLGINYADLVCAKQIHSGSVACVKKQDKGKGALSADTAIPDTDGLITAEKNLPLAIFTADCLSVFFYDPRGRVIGLIHAGWRGTKEGILPNVIKVMREKYKTNPGDLYVRFGPAIRQCCYEVGREFMDFFPGSVTEKAGKFYLDLAGANKRQLLDSGVKETNIYDSLLCTSCRNDDFFSYRREGKSCGRMMSVTMLI